jgi:hypothetical protein
MGEEPPMNAYPKPITFEIRSGLPLLIMSCSEIKRPVEANALVRFADLYDGPTWRQVRASGFPLCNVAAISALYGFLEPGFPVETYDRKLDEEISRRICSTGDHVARLAAAVEAAGSAFVVGGQLYRAVAETALRAFPDRLAGRLAFAAGSYLQQRKQLGAFLREQTRIAA